jgi:endonuclease/exonuclease/phosphatase family metal-dependent hydrolase
MRSRSPAVLVALALVATACGTSSPSGSRPASDASANASTSPVPSLTPIPTAPPAPATLKVMDFNIEYGGDEVDFAKVIEAIKKADPDVVALEEAEGNTLKVGEALGWPYHSVRSQLVSKMPLIDPPDADGRYEFVLVRPDQVVAISNVHLPSDPYGPYYVRDGKPLAEVIKLEQETRMPMLQERLDVLPALIAAGIPTFLTGDFNAPSHLDWTAASVGLRSHVKYAVAWPVSTAIEAAGFRDAYRELHPDPVADPGLTWWAGRPLIDGYPDPSEPQDRIDIIYAAGPSTTDDIRIVGEKGGPQVDIEVDPWGTDHRAVVGTFTVQPAAPPSFVSVDQRLVPIGDAIVARFHPSGAEGQRIAIAKAGSAGEPLLSIGTVDVVDGEWAADSTSLPSGDYEVRLVAADGAVVSSAPVSVAASGTKPSLTLDSATYKAGAPITVTWRDAPGSRWDWIGVYARGGDPLVDSYVYYVYTGQEVRGSVVIDESGEGDWPLPAGDYDAHYLLDDGYASLAVAPFSVTP